MKSLQVFNAVLLAAAAAFAVTMGVVTLLYAIYIGEEPRLRHEWPTVLAVTQVFAVLTALSALAFYGQRRGARWRWLAQGLMLAGLGAGAWILYRILV